MRFCRFERANVTAYGLIDDTEGQDAIRRILDKLPGSEFDFHEASPAEIPLSSVRLLAPVIPSKIVCIGRNYREHAKELNHAIPTEPLIFLKPPSAILAPGQTILRPASLAQSEDEENPATVVALANCLEPFLRLRVQRVGQHGD